MRNIFSAFALAVILSGATACDFIRYPGDGGPPPKTPEPGPAIPPGAPGPPPPDPEDDPWALPPLEEGETETSPETPPEGPPDLTPPAEGGVDVPEESEDVPPAEEEGEDQAPEETPSLPEEGEPSGEGELPGEETGEEAPGEEPAEEGTPPEDEGETLPDTEEEASLPPAPVDPVFSYHAPGALLPGSGSGFPEQIVHAPGIVFPIKSAPSYLQSQVFMYGGGVAGGDQCDARNYAYPWRDNFCETRSANRGSPFCPVNRIHQGQDIRVGTAADCNTMRRQSAAQRGIHEVVAVEDGVISSIGTYTVKLRGEGSIYNYMHLNMNRLAVTAGQFVKAGDLIGYVSNDFGGTPTTIHLHFEIQQNTAGSGWVHVSPYLSLVEAYERRQSGPGAQLEPEIGVASAPEWVIPEGYEIIE